MDSIRNILNSRFKRNGNFFMELTKILGFKNLRMLNTSERHLRIGL